MITCFGKRKKALTGVFYKAQKVFSPGGPNIGFPLQWYMPIIPIMHDYLQYSQVPQSAINELNIDSEARKRFFRNFEKFLVPGLQVQKSRISRDMKYF